MEPIFGRPVASSRASLRKTAGLSESSEAFHRRPTVYFYPIRAPSEQDDSSGRGTALAIIVNDTLAVASAAVASSKKRHQSFAGHEHSLALGRIGEVVLQKRRSRFDRDRFELWRPNGQSGGVDKTPSLEEAGVGRAGSPPAAGEKMRRFEPFHADGLCSKAGFSMLWPMSACRDKQTKTSETGTGSTCT